MLAMKTWSSNKMKIERTELAVSKGVFSRSYIVKYQVNIPYVIEIYQS